MHYLLFLNYHNILYNTFKIVNFIKVELPEPEIDNEDNRLAKIIKKYIVYRLCGMSNTNAPYISLLKSGNSRNTKIYNKDFSK